MSAAADRVSLFGFRLGWRAVRRMPERAAYALFDRIAVVTHRRNTTSVQRLRANYARVRPGLGPAALDALTREGMRSYLRYWCDAFRLPDLDPDELARRVRVEGDGPVREALGSGRGAVCFLGHLGNWDLAGAWSTHHLAPVTTVAERLRPEELFEEFLGYREALGMTILPLTGGDGAFRQLVRAVRAGGLVPLLADRDLTSTGVEVTFCGHPARMAPGPAALSLSTGAPLFPVSVHYEPRPDRPPGPASYRIVITFGPALEAAPGTRQEQVRDLTQQCADFLAAAVREHTEDWHMMQRVFVPAGEVVG